MRLAFLLALPALAAEPVIIDTDCGYFGDDGMAITMFANSAGRFHIEAVTIVSGNVWSGNAIRNTREILDALKLGKTPIIPGEDMPLRHTRGMADEEHRRWGPLEFRGAFGEPHAALKGKPQAVEELIRRIEAKPGAITLVALGPMTNIARALDQRPTLARRIRRLVFMGGQYRVAGNASKEAEFNFWFDPEAASIVLRSSIPEKIMFGLDVCNKANLDKAGFDAIIRKRTWITRRFAEDYGKRYPGFYKNPKATVSLWDALVPLWMLDSNLFEPAESLYLDVDTRFGATYGKVVPLDRASAPDATPVQMIHDVHSVQVMDELQRLMTRMP